MDVTRVAGPRAVREHNGGKTMLKKWIAGMAGTLFLLGMAGPALAGEDAKGTGTEATKAPSPGSALQTALKGLTRAKSYRVSVDIEGGFATQADHEVTQRTVKESYAGDVSGTLMKCPTPKSYRTTAKGVTLVDGQWKAILSDPQAVKMERLFKFPEVILQRALQHAKNGQWLATAAGAEKEPETEAKPEEEEDASSPKPKGKTVVVRKKGHQGRGAVVSASLPRVMKINASPEEALKHILEVQNSNCFGGG